MQGRYRNIPNTKRVFGKDITNYQRRGKNSSITEKTSSLLQTRNKSRSFDKRAIVQQRDPIAQYEGDILRFLLQTQANQQRQLLNYITQDMRQILIDWIVDVHQSFQLKEQTLFLTLAYLNTYTSLVEVNKHDYQLVGIACLWIASKFQEIYPPRMQNYIQVTDSSYSAQELKAMQGKILLTLSFNLNYSTPLHILEAVSERWPKDIDGKMSQQNKRVVQMSKYLIELSLFQNIGKQYSMKTIVLSALTLAASVLKIKPDLHVLEQEGQKVDRDQLLGCFKEMCRILQNVSKVSLKLKAIKKKYSGQKYLGVSKFKLQHR